MRIGCSTAPMKSLATASLPVKVNFKTLELPMVTVEKSLLGLMEPKLSVPPETVVLPE